MSNLLKKEKGFTLIEIVLVLAIAGLLLVIVFLAVQGAQRSRRDTQRKQDAARALASVESCSSNNAGLYPAACTTGLLNVPVGGGTPYFSGTDPNGPAYTYANPPAAVAEIAPASGTCPGAAAGGTAHVSVYQESGPPYCVHN